jgi:hypothetical protein
MLHSQRTGSHTWAFRELSFGNSRHIVTCTLPCVAGFAEMRVAPAEPLRDGATEFAFVFNVLCSMLAAVADSTADIRRHTASTN